jgi:hypothetical protein
MPPSVPPNVRITVNGRPLELNLFAATITANLVDALVDSLRTEGEVRQVVITRER